MTDKSNQTKLIAALFQKNTLWFNGKRIQYVDLCGHDQLLPYVYLRLYWALKQIDSAHLLPDFNVKTSNDGLLFMHINVLDDDVDYWVSILNALPLARAFRTLNCAEFCLLELDDFFLNVSDYDFATFALEQPLNLNTAVEHLFENETLNASDLADLQAYISVNKPKERIFPTVLESIALPEKGKLSTVEQVNKVVNALSFCVEKTYNQGLLVQGHGLRFVVEVNQKKKYLSITVPVNDIFLEQSIDFEAMDEVKSFVANAYLPHGFGQWLEDEKDGSAFYVIKVPLVAGMPINFYLVLFSSLLEKEFLVLYRYLKATLHQKSRIEDCLIHQTIKKLQKKSVSDSIDLDDF